MPVAQTARENPKTRSVIRPAAWRRDDGITIPPKPVRNGLRLPPPALLARLAEPVRTA